MFFLVDFPSIAEVVRDQVDLQLSAALIAGRAQEIIAGINSYMTYGTVEPSEATLVLWMDMGVERRMDRARGQVSLGQVPTTEFALRRSLTVVNHPNTSVSVLGSNHFLVHTSSEASFSLSRQVLNLLRGGRSYRSADRPHTDLEWHIARFFTDLASRRPLRDRLDVMELEFGTMTSRRRSYRLSSQLSLIEPTGGTGQWA
jgi:hypothetical protein